MVRCPKCKTENPGSSRVCAACGSPLRATLSPRFHILSWYVIIPASLIIIVGLFLAHKFILSNRSTSNRIGPSSAVNTKPLRAAQPKTRQKHATGIVTIKNREGKEIARMSSAILDSNWVVLPVCACLGGDSWIFSSPQSKEVRIDRGIWSSGSPAGLWQISSGKQYHSLKLAPWNSGALLKWRSLDMTHEVRQVPVSSSAKEGLFTSLSLSKDLREPGVFIQDEHIVGWTFGKWMERGLLWDGSEQVCLDKSPNLTVSEFVNALSYHWQEAQFSKGLAMGKYSSPLIKFQVLAEGMLLQPQFSSELKPCYLRPGSISTQLNRLASQLIQTGYAEDVLDILSDDLVLKLSDRELLKKATLARVKAYDHWKAARYFERMKRSLSTKGIFFTTELERFHAGLYKDWLRISLAKEEIRSGRMAFETGKRLFPEDAELHILGIQQAVSEKHWDEAKYLLNMRSYPPNLQTQARHLEKLITEKLETKKVVYFSFKPGSKEIVVEASINQSINQYFIVDTGATHVTISSKTADQLGIKITESTPVRPIRTASNIMLAYEVTLGSIAIGDLRANNVTALIIDLPGAPGAGLLGNNFLNHFNVEIDNEKGILKLSPH